MIEACVDYDCIAGFILQVTRLHEIVLNTMFCIVAGKGCSMQNCIAIQNCIATERLGSWAGAGRAGVGAGGRRCGRVGRLGAGRASGHAGAGGRASRRRAGARRAQAGRRQRVRQAQAGRRRGRAGPWAWARGVRGLGVPVGVGWACWLGQLGQVGALCTWLSSDSVFGPGLTQYQFLSH